MGDLTPIRPKLAVLIPRLASDADGEVVATARAIGRQLESAGADWHALAEAVTAEPRERIIYREREPEPEPDPRNVVFWLAERAYRLRSRERSFINDLAARARVGRLRLSEKQGQWLCAIYARVLREVGAFDE